MSSRPTGLHVRPVSKKETINSMKSLTYTTVESYSDCLQEQQEDNRSLQQEQRREGGSCALFGGEVKQTSGMKGRVSTKKEIYIGKDFKCLLVLGEMMTENVASGPITPCASGTGSTMFPTCHPGLVHNTLTFSSKVKATLEGYSLSAMTTPARLSLRT